MAVTGEREPEARKEVVRRRLAFEENPAAFRAQWARREERLAGQLAAARALLPQVDVGEAEEQAACLLARQANAAGHRAELAILHTARALAALAGRTYINLEDLHTAAELALPHRRREGSEGPPPRQERGEEPPQGSGADGQAGGGDGPADESHPADGPPQEGVQAPAPPTEQGPSRERLEQGEDLYEVRALLTTRADRLARRGSGRRSKTRSATRRGRAVGDRIPRGKAEDLAVGATLRAAAPYQWSRGGGQSGLVILPPDLRVKVRESRVGADIVFAVDASGSMGAARRMKEVKEAVLSMLMDSYQKRDQVGLVAFRGGEAAAVLELTRSVELAQRELQALPTGGRTPLAAGLEEARRMLERQRRRVRDSLPLLVLITDGRANFSRGGDPVEEALRAARRVAEAHIPAVVIDTERQFVSLGRAAQVAQVRGAPCYRVEELRARPLAQLVRGHSPAAG
ncbi:MAG: VWA domain-containing protein [Flavonifractor plautii]